MTSSLILSLVYPWHNIFHWNKIFASRDSIPQNYVTDKSRVHDVVSLVSGTLRGAVYSFTSDRCLEEKFKMKPIIDFFTLNLHFEWLLKNHQLSILIISSKTFSIWGKGRLRETKTNKINKNWQIRIEKVQILHTLSTELSHPILRSDSNKLIWISKYLNLSFEWNIFKQVLNIGCYRSNVRFYFITGHCGSWFEWYFQYSDQCADWMVMRMYLAAIWADNAMEDNFTSISNTFHFDPNCLLIFTGYCGFCLSKFWFTVTV